MKPRSRSSVGPFLGGAAIGAASALLFAPQSGRQTRDQIAGFVSSGKRKTAQLQDAMYAAIEAARLAFLDALNEEDPRLQKAEVEPRHAVRIEEPVPPSS